MKLLIICLALSWPLSVCAQPSVTLGTPFKTTDASQAYYFRQGNDALAVTVNEQHVTVKRLQVVGLTLQSEKSYDYPKTQRPVKVVGVGGRYFLYLYVASDQTLLVQEIEFTTGEVAGSPSVVVKGGSPLAEDQMQCDQKFKGDAPADGYAGSGDFSRTEFVGFYCSRDSSRVLLKYYRGPGKDKKGGSFMGLVVYDKSMKELWRTEVAKPIPASKERALDYGVDSKGNAYIATAVYTGDQHYPQNIDGKPNYAVEVTRISPTQQGNKFTLALPAGKFIQTLRMTEDATGNINCSGQYNLGLYIEHRNNAAKADDNTDRHYMTADGFFTATLVNGKFVVNTFEIPVALINQDKDKQKQRVIERLEEKKQAEYPLLFLKEVVPLHDGGLLMVSQLEYHDINYAQTTFNFSIEDSFYNDLVVTRIAPDGTLKWMKNLTKQPADQNEYKLLVSDNAFYFVYNDNEMHRPLGDKEFPLIATGYRRFYMAVYEITDATGEVKKHALARTGKVDIIEVDRFSAGRVMLLSPGVFVFECVMNARKEQNVLVRATF